MSDQNTEAVKTTGNISANKYLWVVGALTLLGVIGGYAYYALVGCNGSCTIQSNPYLSMLWGGAMGYLIPDMFLKPRKEEKKA